MIKTKIIAFTNHGAKIAQTLVNNLNDGYYVSAYYKEKYPDLLVNKLSLNKFTKEAFNDSRLIIYIGAIGIATRAIAPFIKSKDVDPAIICIDDQANYVIPLLSGHLGNANNFALEISKILEAKPIITTSTDINNVFAIDNFALKNNLLIDDISKIKDISSELIKGNKIGLVSDYPIDNDIPDFIDKDNHEVGIYLGDDTTKYPFNKSINLRYKKYVVGIGVRKDKESEVLEEYFLRILKENKIDYRLVSTIVSIDLKKEELALINLANKYRYKFITYSSDELAQVEGEYTASDFVKKTTGVDNVCERSVAKYAGYNNIIMKKTSENGMTLALAKVDARIKF